MAVTPPTPEPTEGPTPGGATSGPQSGGAAGRGPAGRTAADPASQAGRFPPDEPNGRGAPASWREVLASMVERLGEIRDYVGYYAETKSDGVKQQAIWAGIYAALGILAGLIGAAVLVTATVLLVNGIAGGLAALFGHREWLGQLVTGLLLLGLFAGGAVVGLKVLRASFKKKLRAKYEQRHQEQRGRFGADVPQRARERQEQQL